MEDPAVSAWKSLLELVGWGGRRPPRFPAVAMQLGMAPKQLGLIWRLEPGATLSMREIGESLYCDASYVTDLVDRLEERGLIERRPSPDDRRVTLIALTAEGESVRREALELLYEPPEEFGALDADELRDAERPAREGRRRRARAERLRRWPAPLPSPPTRSTPGCAPTSSRGASRPATPSPPSASSPSSSASTATPSARRSSGSSRRASSGSARAAPRGCSTGATSAASRCSST